MNSSEPFFEKAAENLPKRKYATWVGVAMCLTSSLYMISTVVGISTLLFLGKEANQMFDYHFFLNNSVYFIMMAFMMVGGILTLRKKRLGVVFSNAAIIYWLVSRFVIFLMFFVNGGIGLIPCLADILGLNIPPTIFSVSTAIVNVAVITSFVLMRKSEFKSELGLNLEDRIPGLGIGILLLLYSLITWYLMMVDVLS